MQHTKFFLSMLCCILFISCAKHQVPEENIQQPEQTSQTKTPKSIPSAFKLTGAMAVNNNGKGWNAGLTWSQKGPNSYTIRLTGPLGGKNVIISKQGSTVTYQEGSNIIKANNESELLAKKSNINLPVNNLYYWIRGIPAPGSVSFSKKDNLNNYMLISQDGFRVTYFQYTTNENGVMLPKKVKITKKNLTIKVVIKSWS